MISLKSLLRKSGSVWVSCEETRSFASTAASLHTPSATEELTKIKFFLISLLMKCDDLSEENRAYTMSYKVEEEIINLLEKMSGQKELSSGHDG